ncbi:SigE family RNA polymerase sigma factor [Gammaproteobacteria bacterium AB-CW1]|uniref:SigE family RNA polymerase sigma factor n=1 Tax=Natronospira elongata TaxID=3110268 RepID=A0AAP6MKM0_9GAMM|nr:SigE family RNA polymerase sigma factor [Gammaproteobacteria bacterium AB-CW1]
MDNKNDSQSVDSKQAWVVSASRGDREAFDQLYRHYGGRLLATAWRLAGGDRGRAEDWVQDCFLQAWQKLGQLRDPQAFGGWLRRLLVNISLADKRRPRLLTQENPPEQAAGEPPWPCADRDLERAITGLPDNARLVLVLFHLEGMSHEEIASTAGIAVGTSKAQLHRARKLLKEVLSHDTH